MADNDPYFEGDKARVLQYMQKYANPSTRGGFLGMFQDEKYPKPEELEKHLQTRFELGEDDLTIKLMKEMFKSSFNPAAPQFAGVPRERSEEDYVSIVGGETKQPLYKQWQNIIGR